MKVTMLNAAPAPPSRCSWPLEGTTRTGARVSGVLLQGLRWFGDWGVAGMRQLP
jgi:hypothetical protein